MSQESSWLLWLSLKIYSKNLMICIMLETGPTWTCVGKEGEKRTIVKRLSYKRLLLTIIWHFMLTYVISSNAFLSSNLWSIHKQVLPSMPYRKLCQTNRRTNWPSNQPTDGPEGSLMYMHGLYLICTVFSHLWQPHCLFLVVLNGAISRGEGWEGGGGRSPGRVEAQRRGGRQALGDCS